MLFFSETVGCLVEYFVQKFRPSWLLSVLVWVLMDEVWMWREESLASRIFCKAQHLFSLLTYIQTDFLTQFGNLKGVSLKCGGQVEIPMSE